MPTQMKITQRYSLIIALINNFKFIMICMQYLRNIRCKTAKGILKWQLWCTVNHLKHAILSSTLQIKIRTFLYLKTFSKFNNLRKDVE